MANFASDERAKRDILTCLGIWLTLELICFTILPLLNLLTPGDRFLTWFTISLPLGVGGALLVGTGSHLPFLIGDRAHRLLKTGIQIVRYISTWVGLAGMAFPILVVCIELFTKIITQNLI